jgi:hypothetical protein
MTGLMGRALMTGEVDRPPRPSPHARMRVIARRHVGASIRDTWTPSLDHGRATLDVDPVFEHTVILRATTQALGLTREAVFEAVVQRLDVSQKHAAEAYALAAPYETIRVLSGATCKD